MKHPITLNLMLLVCVGICDVAVAQTDSATVKSPDGRLELVFLTASQGKASAAGGQLLYRISYQGKALLADSQLGLAPESGDIRRKHAHYLGRAGQRR